MPLDGRTEPSGVGARACRSRRHQSLDKGWMADKDRTSDWRKTSTVRIRRKTKVSNPRNPMPCISLAINFVSVIVDYRVESIGSTMKDRLGIDREIELLRERNAILSIRTTICNVRNPKTRKVGLLILTVKNINVIGREPRGVRSGCVWRRVRSRCVWAEPEYKQRIKPQVITVRNRDSKNAERWSSGGKTKRRLKRARWNRREGNRYRQNNYQGRKAAKPKGKGPENLTRPER